MRTILFKRALRDLRAGASRYIALALLIIFAVFIVVSLMGSAITVIDNTEVRDRELICEDGEFTVFVPLSNERLDQIESRGVTIEEMFYADYPLDGGKILRVFKVREHINQISIVEGRLPQSDDEAVLERRFSEVNGINTGDTVTVGGTVLTVCGIGATPDYNNVYRKVSDNVVDSRMFGTVFVTEARYDQMLLAGTSISTEEYNYVYLLNGAMTDEELKVILEEDEFDAGDVTDEFFLEYWERMTGRKDDLLEGIDELCDGATELADGAEELRDGIDEFHDGMTELHDAVPDLTNGINELNDGASDLENGVRAYVSGVNSAADGAAALSQGAGTLADGSSQLNSGANEYAEGVVSFSDSVSAMTMSDDPYVAGVASGLSEPASGLSTGFTQIQSGISGVNEGASGVSSGASQLSEGMGTLRENGGALVSGADSLHNGTSELAGGAEDLADGIDELYDGSSEIRDGSEELSDGARELADGVREFSDEADDLIDEVFNIKTQNLRMFLTADENPRVDAAADDVQINLSASIIFGVLIIMLFSYVISVFIVHNIDKESSVIGALYSMGVKRITLMLSYVSVPVMICALAGIAGTALAIFTPLGIKAQLNDSLSYFSMPAISIKVTSFILIYGLVVPPLTALIVNILVIRKRLTRTPLSLLKNEKKAVRGKDLKLKKLKFIDMFRIRQMIRESRSGITVILGLFLSLLITFLALNTTVYCLKVKDLFVSQTNFSYMYTYKYPTEEPPEGGYEAVAEGLKKEIYGYTFDVSVMGITEDNPFFETGTLPSNNTDVVISSSVADKYDLDVGDEFTLSDKNGDRLYAFRVDSIVDYSASLMVFMDIDRCRDLFDEDDDYYNVVFSDHELDIDSGRLYSVLSRDDIAKSAGIYVDMMIPMITTMATASAVIFVVVMYLMLKMMLDRSAFNISLVKIFGFRNREVRKMYIDGNFYLVAAGALVSIPLCKGIMDYIYPRYLVSNVGVGITPTYSPELYVVIFAVIIGLYLIINFALVGKIRKIDPAEVLKNRE